jgi:hypothetical protein
MGNAATITNETLPNNLAALRTGTANDGRVLIRCPKGPNRASALEDIRTRLPRGWTADIYAPSDHDIVLTHACAE